MLRTLLALGAVLAFGSLSMAGEERPLLLQRPAVSRTQVAFVYAGDLWTVGRQGGDARRLTSGAGVETDPHFSPDGRWIAFTGEYEGNPDVYVIPSEGGVPRRLTYHPGPDQAVGWTPDGKRVLFRSQRNSFSRFTRLFTVSLDGGLPAELPLPEAYEGSYSPDGAHLAYVPIPPAFQIWKRYRGGKTTPIWVARLSDSSIEKIPRDNSNDFCPMWLGDRVYFLSDRNGPFTLFSYDLRDKHVTQVLRNDGLDLKSASAGPDAIVYEQFGSLHLFDPQSGKEQKLDIRVAGDLPGVRPRFEKVARSISAANLSPTGVRAVFAARGEILTVPVEKGHVRNLTNSPGVADRDPAWSPNGKWIAYLSDESGEYQLHIRDQRGLGEVKKFTLGDAPSFYYGPTWSPDSRRIAYTDKRLNLWVIDLPTRQNRKVDQDTYDAPSRTLDPCWSPDGRWLAYTKRLKNHLRAVFLCDVNQGKTHQVTDGMSDARFATFDKNGKYLYFTASTDAGPTTGWLDMSSFNHPVSSSVYVVVLDKKQPSPLAPESDEERGGGESPLAQEAAAQAPAKPASGPGGKKGPAAAGTTIDVDNIDQRILALPLPPRNYVGLAAGKPGTLLILEAPAVPQGGPPATSLHRFDMQRKKADKILDGVTSLDVAHNGEKMLYRQGENWFIAATAAPVQPGAGLLKLDELEVKVDPRAEWRQMYHETWRIERDFLYDPGAHGLDLKAAEKKYAPYLEGLGSREDLNYLFSEMLGELSLGHTYVRGGDSPTVKAVPGGLLGCDYELQNGRYRFARVYPGHNWNPQNRSPLTQPGVNVKAGEYLLGVNGKSVTDKDDIYQVFEGTAGKNVLLLVGPNPNGAGAREVTVVPLTSELQLRHLNWIEDNRRKVDRLSGGRVAYVYLPDTAQGGYTNFNRYYFAQLDREGAVIDERFNGGGTAADYIIDYMHRPLMNYWTTREGHDFTTPVGSIFGPKAMIINEYAGSGGDAMPWYFRKAGIGPLVGKRTWGGLVGIYDYPPLIDGGSVTAPRVAFWRPEGSWDVENHGVAPDMEVELDPKAVREGHDPQLEKAVALVLEEIRKHPVQRPRHPAFPNYHKGAPAEAATEAGSSSRK